MLKSPTIVPRAFLSQTSLPILRRLWYGLRAGILRRLLLFGVVVASGTARADTIGLRWADTPDAQKHAGGGTVEIYAQLVNKADNHPQSPAYNFGSASGDLVCVNFNCADLVIGNFANADAPPGWKVFGFPGGIADVAGIITHATDTGIEHGPAGSVIEHILGTFDIDFTGDADGSEAGFAIGFHWSSAGVRGGDGAPLIWDGRYGAIYSGYIAYDGYGTLTWGCGAKGCPPESQFPNNPLIITKVPEPASLAAIVLGGFALTCRRRSCNAYDS